MVSLGPAPVAVPHGAKLTTLLRCFEVRIAMECDAAYYAAQRRSDEHLRGMEAAIVEMENALQTHSLDHEAHFKFHMLIAEAADNPFMVASLCQIEQHMEALMNLLRNLWGIDPDQPISAGEYRHHDIFVAIRDQQPEAAGEAMYLHLTEAMQGNLRRSGGTHTAVRRPVHAMSEMDDMPVGATAEARLAALGIVLPPPPVPSANYVLARSRGGIVFLSGRGGRDEAGVQLTGRLGDNLSVEEGYAHARRAGLLILSALKQAVGTLEGIEVLRVFGMVSATAEFRDHSRVIDGCSDLLVAVLGDAGRHARSAVGMSSLPGGMSVEIETTFARRS